MVVLGRVNNNVFKSMDKPTNKSATLKPASSISAPKIPPPVAAKPALKSPSIASQPTPGEAYSPSSPPKSPRKSVVLCVNGSFAPADAEDTASFDDNSGPTLRSRAHALGDQLSPPRYKTMQYLSLRSFLTIAFLFFFCHPPIPEPYRPKQT